ncbi:hypothetical protein ACFSPU_13645 [Haoranjiania flava]|uniref:Uncharacterized protein n=1 Tax=Haoranjiania flava TaxID=1856322 RepID=A0AAE3IMT7_9BACT|nr:hypothetical protein [Haoranjiania flava]MCU7694957.1 hypothetical protein [Haoranjiania flava]
MKLSINHSYISISVKIKCLLLVAAVACTVPVSAQTEIDRINSDSAAMQFFRKHVIGTNTKSNFNDFKLIDGTEWINFYNFSEQQKNDLLGRYKYRKWAKLDLNGDKKDDLVISGYLSKKAGYSQHYRLFIFLADNYNNFPHIKYNSPVPTYFNVLETDGKNYLEIAKWTNDLYKKVEGVPLRVDTVMFHPEIQMLVDYKKLVDPATIARVVYTEQYFPKGNIQVTLVNQRERNSDMVITEDAQNGKKPAVHNAKIAKDMMGDFLDVVATLRRYEKSKDASIVMNDDTFTSMLEVHYADGSKQVFNDNTGESSYSLKAVYDWLRMSVSNVFEQMAQRQQSYYYYDPFDW